tara:strand:- start:1377 stop:1766 length:390 start_codon:yes stop_codon:yes gene_type:complete
MSAYVMLAWLAAVHAVSYGPDYACAECKLPIVCNYGKYIVDPFSDGTCVDCPAGKYKDTILWYDTECKTCADGKDSNPGSASCVAITYIDDDTATPAPADDAYPNTNAAAIGVGGGAVVAVAYYSTAST